MKLSGCAATKMIHICVGVLFKSPFVFVAAFLVVACMVGFFVLCAIAALRTCGYYHGQDNDSTAWGLFFFFLLFALWGLEICRNVVHVTACGVLGQWYFSNHTLTTFPCLLRAVTVNFGSICLGSLLVAIVETIRAVLLWIKERQCASNCCVTFVFCCIDCCLGCIQSIFELINAYAFVHCAIYGEGFCHAAKSALQFLEGAALTAIISDDIIKRFLFAGSFIGAFFNGCFIASLGKDENNFTGEEAAAWGVSIGIVSYFFIYIMLSPLLSAVEALLVCFAEEPVILHDNHDEEYHSLIGAWTDVFGGEEVPQCVAHAEEKVKLRKSQMQPQDASMRV
eukprot:TRINITY_DN8037_c0_g1_i4.p1 TRINITY_DN8037_c0_g1~~TRINITY_DN8037_c0_g1_i4.p1  ORF type:complete len:338 (-),score=79.12 TRINITY_DN8037_c0_g1_i4:237-1250(-)